jgi:hypothetical protein
MKTEAILITCGLALYSLSCLCMHADDGKPRVIVTTDGEIDDKTSFIRYLMYSNEFETLGLIYGNSKWQIHGHGTVWMQETIDVWNGIRDNLLLHQDGYPTAEELKAVCFAGNMDVNYLHHTGPLESEGARHIIRVLLDPDPRPVWVQAWGGTNTIAQALSILDAEFGEKEIAHAHGKLKLFAIADQDDTAAWIRANYPQVFYIQCHQFTALNYQHEGHPYSDHAIFSEAWTRENVKDHHGPLGALYPQTYFSEGDSPAFFHLIGNGLRAETDPTWGGWGGRFMQYEGQSFYSDAVDEGDRLHGQWIWLIDIQNDFAARMDWCLKSVEEANHYPVIGGNLPDVLQVKAGDRVELDATGSTDPDGDAIAYHWWHYRFAGTQPYPEEIPIQHSTEAKVTVEIPADASGKVIHLILTLSDDGEPMLKRYKRIVLEVK